MKKKIDELISGYSERRAALLPVLHITQKEFGQITSVEEKLVAELLDIKPIEVHEVVTFYSMFNQKKVGKYHIQICSNLTCTLLGAGNLLEYLQNKLGIKPGETTDDEKFTLSTVECLGACEEAPVMMVNFDYHGHLDEKKIDKLLDNLK
ncbi:MAG: NADH-quinone oxidoreductase subunit NuoE [Candidatus Aminicenantes bacterium]|nr:NADH-quinone oxidoreductase subunit NuoE [Candidatus Aminicenantes bacterium]